ncbi:DUF1905 domain-containing protein [Patescibacteria group bacterium]|nr:MAG: DUF1905 domain-containing protein [Patescibacteria group bacterium]
MKPKTYTFKAKLWIYPGNTAWHFVTINKVLAKKINDDRMEPRGGWGSIPMTVSVGDTVWDTSIFWSKDGTFLLPIKNEVRKKEGIYADDTVHVTLATRHR